MTSFCVHPYPPKVTRNSFSTGFIFNYWDKRHERFVKPVYGSLKEEVIESGFLSKSKWIKFVELKARKYLNSAKVRKIRAGRAMYLGSRHVALGKPMTLVHLCAIILYCDFGKLCTKFSATFREEDSFEDLESVKRRHAKFGHFGRFLVESVLEFGINGIEYYGDKDYSSVPAKDYISERGPFFCGLNSVLNIGSYAITMKGPCSTSISKAVAVNFAKSNGIILKLNNDGYQEQFQRFFDCSFLSNYFEENERLWISATNPLRIVSITIIRTAKKYEAIIHALHSFDSIISGIEQLNSRESPSDKALISNLLNLKLNGDALDETEYDEYLLNEWNIFLQQREVIHLKLRLMDESYPSLAELLMYDVVDNKWKKANGKDNVLRSQWLSIFPSLHTVIINTWGYSYKFRWESLLETLKEVPSSITFVIDSGGEEAENTLSDEKRALFGDEGWNIEFDDEEGVYVIQYKA